MVAAARATNPRVGTTIVLFMGLAMLAHAQLSASGAAPSATHRVQNEYFKVAVVVGDETLGGHTYLSELFLNQDHFARSAGFGWTANLVFNYSQRSGTTNRGRLSGTALVTVDRGGNSTWHAPLYGTVAAAPAVQEPGATVLRIAGIALGTAATESWTIALRGPAISWGVERTMGPRGVNASCDRGPTLVLNAEYTTTGHVLRTSTQIPSFLDANLMWDPLSGTGFECHISGYAANQTALAAAAAGSDSVPAAVPPTAAAPGFWSEALTARTSQNILLSPSSMALASTATAAGTTDGAVESSSPPLYFALSYPTTPGTGGGDTTMALGLTTIRPPSHRPKPLPPVPEGGAAPSRCAIALEGSAGGAGGAVHLGGCPAGALIDSVVFASFGTPAGDCHRGFTRDKDCDDKYSVAVVSKACIGKANCTVPALSNAFGGADPCPNIHKYLSAEIHCAGDPPPPPMPPPLPSVTANATLLPANTVVSITWDMELSSGKGVSTFVLQTGDAAFDDRMHLFAAVYNMWAGNIFGNSPASIVCLHEMSWFAQIASAFDSPLGPDSVHSALASELRMFARFAIQPNGFVYARWNQWAYINMTIHDQLPHYILCNYYQVMNTGDKAFLEEVWPALQQAMAYVLRGGGRGMGMADDPFHLATTPTAGGLPGEASPDNWLDIVNFGGKDAIINSYLITALRAMAEMADFLGGQHAAEAGKWRVLHAKAVAGFNSQFFNESAGLYSDWIDTQGRRRNYFYVWQQFNSIDPASGITNTSRASQMLAVIDRYYSDMRDRYNKTVDELWCTPTNLDAQRGANWSGIHPDDTVGNGALQDQRWFGHVRLLFVIGCELVTCHERTI